MYYTILGRMLCVMCHSVSTWHHVYVRATLYIRNFFFPFPHTCTHIHVCTHSRCSHCIACGGLLRVFKSPSFIVIVVVVAAAGKSQAARYALPRVIMRHREKRRLSSWCARNVARESSFLPYGANCAWCIRVSTLLYRALSLTRATYIYTQTLYLAPAAAYILPFCVETSINNAFYATYTRRVFSFHCGAYVHTRSHCCDRRASRRTVFIGAYI